MTTIKAFIKSHPVLTFYALVFAISWGGFLIVVGPSGLAVVEIPPGAILSMVAGPVVAGILLTGLVYGKAGFREFRSRLFRWRVGARWYAVALLPAPLLVAGVLFALSLASPVFLPGIVQTDDKVVLSLVKSYHPIVSKSRITLSRQWRQIITRTCYLGRFYEHIAHVPGDYGSQ